MKATLEATQVNPQAVALAKELARKQKQLSIVRQNKRDLELLERETESATLNLTHRLELIKSGQF